MNIILISIDSLRRDYLGCYNPSRKDITPCLTRLGEEGLVFENHYTVSNGSNPSHCSILTGTYPVTHGVHQNGWRLSSHLPTLGEELQKRGYYTVGAVSLETLSSIYGLNRGFDTFFDNSKYDQIMRFLAKVGYKRYTLAKLLQQRRIFDTHSRPYQEINKDILPWLEKNHHKKFFLFVHYFDLHRDTYGRENNKYGNKFKQENYQHNVALADKAVQQVLDKLQEKKILENTVIILLSDHGENIMEKYPKVAHGWEISQQEFNTPLLIHNIKATPARIPHLSRTIDVMPTILELAGCPLPATDGKSLLPLITKNDHSNAPTAVIMENYAGFKNIKAIKKDHWFYILRDDIKEELFHDQEDYQLNQNIIAKHPDVAAKLKAVLQLQYQQKKTDQQTDQYTKEMLRKLGYLE